MWNVHRMQSVFHKQEIEIKLVLNIDITVTDIHVWEDSMASSFGNRIAAQKYVEGLKNTRKNWMGISLV